MKKRTAQPAFALFRYRFLGRVTTVRPPLSRSYQSMVNALRNLGVEIPPPYGGGGIVDLFALRVVDVVEIGGIMEIRA